MNDTVLDVRNLRVEFLQERKTEPTVAVGGISFQLQQGQVLGLVGESGSGKSVTSLAIMGLIPSPGKIAGGEIWFRPAKQNQENREVAPTNLLAISEGNWRQYRGGEIATIFQEPMSSLNPVYNIGFQITEAIRLHQNVTLQQANHQAIALLQEVRVLVSDEQLEQEYLARVAAGEIAPPAPVTQQVKAYIQQQKAAILKRYPHELSGGQLQRVMIAMAISCEPTLLIADEPTTALDVTVQAEILRLLRELCKSHRNMSMIFISHDLGVINEIADFVAVMYDGKIVEQGDKEHILFNPQHPYTKGLLACRPRLHSQPKKLPTVADYMEVEKYPDGEVKLIRDKVPPKINYISREEERQRSVTLQGELALLSVKNLCVQFPKRGVFGGTKEFFKAVDDVSFDVKHGETLGLVGESGCGKSTLARAILRLIPITKGDISFRGESISRLSLGDPKLRHLRREMQIIFQNPYNSLNPRLTIGKAIMEPMVIHKTGGSMGQKKERVAYLLDRVKLEPNWYNRYPHELSGGQRQRVCIARSLALNPQFIICDESVSALDVSVQAGVLNLLKELQQEFNLTYIFISHDLSVVRFMSDRILVINKGREEEINSAEAIINSPQSEYTQKLIASIPECPEDVI